MAMEFIKQKVHGNIWFTLKSRSKTPLSNTFNKEYAITILRKESLCHLISIMPDPHNVKGGIKYGIWLVNN
jgi:hypothetical protein